MSTSIRRKIDNEVESSLGKLVKDNKKHKYGSSNLIGPFLFEEKKSKQMWMGQKVESLPRPTKNTVGVYVIRHIPDNVIVYVGRGNVQQRISRVKTIHSNEGKRTGGSMHDGAKKMYEHDENLANYDYTYISFGEKNGDPVKNMLLEMYSKIGEAHYFKAFNPIFNKEEMIGV